MQIIYQLILSYQKLCYLIWYGGFLGRLLGPLNHGKIINIYIVYEIDKNVNISSYPTPENCLFGTVKISKYMDIDMYKYSGYGIGFDRRNVFSIGDEVGRNVIIFGVAMSSSWHTNNNKKNILIFGEGPKQGLEHAPTAEKLYSINFTKSNTKFCLSLHYNGTNIDLFVNGTEIIKFKAKDSEIAAYPLFLGNISKDFSIDSVKKTGLKGYVYDFSVNYNALAVADILEIQK